MVKKWEQSKYPTANYASAVEYYAAVKKSLWRTLLGKGFESKNARGNWKEKQPVYDGGSGNVVWFYFLHFAKFSPGVFLTWSYGPPAGRGSLRIPKTVSQYCVYMLCSHLRNKLLKWWNLIIPFWFWPPGKLSHFFDKKTKHEALTILFPYTGSPSRGKGKPFVAYQSHPQEPAGLRVPQELMTAMAEGVDSGVWELEGRPTFPLIFTLLAQGPCLCF